MIVTLAQWSVWYDAEMANGSLLVSIVLLLVSKVNVVLVFSYWTCCLTCRQFCQTPLCGRGLGDGLGCSRKGGGTEKLSMFKFVGKVLALHNLTYCSFNFIIVKMIYTVLYTALSTGEKPRWRCKLGSEGTCFGGTCLRLKVVLVVQQKTQIGQIV